MEKGFNNDFQNQKTIAEANFTLVEVNFAKLVLY
jgi:hypothetical protein